MLLTSEIIDLESVFLVCRYFFRIYRSGSYIKVIGSRLSSQEQDAKIDWQTGTSA